MHRWLPALLSRRGFLGAGVIATAGAAATARGTLGQTSASHGEAAGGGSAPVTPHHGVSHGAMITVGEVDSARNGFDPTAMLTDWYTGEV